MPVGASGSSRPARRRWRACPSCARQRSARGACRACASSACRRGPPPTASRAAPPGRAVAQLREQAAPPPRASCGRARESPEPSTTLRVRVPSGAIWRRTTAAPAAVVPAPPNRAPRPLSEHLGEEVVRGAVGQAHQRRERRRGDRGELAAPGPAPGALRRCSDTRTCSPRSAPASRGRRSAGGSRWKRRPCRQAAVVGQRAERPDVAGRAPKPDDGHAAQAVEEGLVPVDAAGDAVDAGVASALRQVAHAGARAVGGADELGAAEGRVAAAPQVEVAVAGAVGARAPRRRAPRWGCGRAGPKRSSAVEVV